VDYSSYDLIPPYFSTSDEQKVCDNIPNLKDCIAINVNASDLAFERRRPVVYYQKLINALVQK